MILLAAGAAGGGCTADAPGRQRDDVAGASSGLQLAPATFNILLRSPKGSAVVDLALGAAEQIELAPGSSVKRSNGEPALMAALGAPGITMLPGAVGGHAVSTTAVEVHPNAHLIGGIDAPSPKLLPNAQVDGPVNSTPILTPLEDTSFTIDFPQGNAFDVSVSPHKTYDLAPGRYASVSVAPNAQLTLHSGAYFFESFSTQPKAKLVLAQQGGPTHLFARQAPKLAGTLDVLGKPRGLVLVQIDATPLDVALAFRGVIVAPDAELRLADAGAPHRGAFFARAIKLGAKAGVVYEPPNALVGLIPGGLEHCADLIRPREDTQGKELERAYQADIARYCTMRGVEDCAVNLAGRVNVDYFLAASAFVGGKTSPAQYLALSRDRTRKRYAAEDNPLRALALCQGLDDDGDWIPNADDKCPGTPELTPTHDDGCTDPKLPAAPSAADMKALFAAKGIQFNPACAGAGVLPRLPAGAFYRPANAALGTYILSGRVLNQPPGCPMWYFFDVQELLSGNVIRSYSVGFAEAEQATALIGFAKAVPPGLIQFNPKPTDPGTRGLLGAAGPGKVTVRFRVKPVNGNGLAGDWSEWKISTKDDCPPLGFTCP